MVAGLLLALLWSLHFSLSTLSALLQRLASQSRPSSSSKFDVRHHQLPWHNQQTAQGQGKASFLLSMLAPDPVHSPTMIACCFAPRVNHAKSTESTIVAAPPNVLAPPTTIITHHHYQPSALSPTAFLCFTHVLLCRHLVIERNPDRREFNQRQSIPTAVQSAPGKCPPAFHIPPPVPNDNCLSVHSTRHECRPKSEVSSIQSLFALVSNACISREQCRTRWLCMDGWMEGWMEGWMDGWRDGWMDGWMDGWPCRFPSTPNPTFPVWS